MSFVQYFTVGHPLALGKGSEMLKIQRAENGDVVFTLSGRIEQENVAELEALLAREGKARPIVLDLKDLTLTGQDGIDFLARSEAAGVTLTHCDPYVREWIARQKLIKE